MPVNSLPILAAPDPSAPRDVWHDWCLAERQAAALTWSRAQADTVAAAILGHLYRDDQGITRNRAAGGSGRRVHSGRVRALRRAGFLTYPGGAAGGSGLIEATDDGIRAWAAWTAWKPAPVARTARQEGEDLPPLHKGAEQQRRARQAAAREAIRRAQRDAEWAEFCARRDAADAREARDAAYREAMGIANPWAKAPEGWEPPADGGRHPQPETGPRVVVTEESTPNGHVTVYTLRDGDDEDQAPAPAAPALGEETAPAAGGSRATGCTHTTPARIPTGPARPTTRGTTRTRPTASRPALTPGRWQRTAPHEERRARPQPRPHWGTSTPGRTGLTPRRPLARTCTPPTTEPAPAPPEWIADHLDAA